MAVETRTRVRRPPFPRFRSITEFESEATFRSRLAGVLRSYGFSVLCSHPDGGPRLSMHNSKSGRPDLYLFTPKTYEWRSRFPYIVLETKLAKNLRWLRDGKEQVQQYVADVYAAQYTFRDRLLPRPSLFLICTQDSWNDGHLYNWNLPELATRTPEYRSGWLDGFTDTWNRFLNPDVAILLGGSKGAHFKISNARSGERVARCDLAW